MSDSNLKDRLNLVKMVITSNKDVSMNTEKSRELEEILSEIDRLLASENVTKEEMKEIASRGINFFTQFKSAIVTIFFSNEITSSYIFMLTH